MTFGLKSKSFYLKANHLRTEQIQPVCVLEQNFTDLYWDPTKRLTVPDVVPSKKKRQPALWDPGGARQAAGCAH